MHPLPRARERGRLAALALAGVFTASACTTLATQPLAGEPAVPSEPDQTSAMATASPMMQASPDAPASPSAVTIASSVSTPTISPAPSPLLEVTQGKANATSKVKVVRLKPRPKPGPFSMNLYQAGDFVHQQTKDWCVAGSTQTMMNIMDRGRPNASKAFQRRLYYRGRRLSANQAKLTSIGVDLTGWANLLSTHGYGRYEVDGRPSRRGAIRAAAKAIRETGRPVGLVVWRGAHSWVMSGFTATADPAYTNDFEIRSVFIQDVWYPYVSTIWGASRPPNTAVPVARLREDYLPYRRPSHRWPKRDGKFMLVLPALPKGTVAR